MSELMKGFAEACAAGLELAGVVVITGAAVFALAAIVPAFRNRDDRSVADQVRHRLGTGVLLGLELLVAADIIYTVAIELTYENVGVLAIIVGIRTLISFTLEVEMNGRWPWQRGTGGG